MPKIKIHVTLVNAEGKIDYTIPAIYQEEDKIIVYKEQDEQNTSVRFNYVTKELVRENDSLIMNYTFNKEKNTQGSIYVKGMDKKLDVVIKTTKLLRCDKNIEIEYQIENDKFNYKIEVI